MSAGNAPARSFVLGTAGHIDHGKTALVRALTGVDTDRLPEEKKRGITIDLGFANLTLEAPSGPVEVSIVDVPGHHAFVRNMLAGAGGMDAVLLVVAADQGPQPQTREHLHICTLLGIDRGIVALTKADLVDEERLKAARAEVGWLLESGPLENAPVIAVSARTGLGMGALGRELVQLTGRVAPPDESHLLRLPIDRIFAVRGFGTVATGTLHAGRVQTGDALEVQPGGRAVRVRGLEVHGQATAVALAPTRLALNLPNVEVGELKRGDTLVAPGSAEPAGVVDVELVPVRGEELPRHRSQVRVHAFASEATATLLLYAEGPVPMARLRLHEALLLLPGDRLVLRQPARGSTVAGARVLDAHPLPRLRKRATAAWLGSLRTAADTADALRLRVERRGIAGLPVAELARETGLQPDALQRAMAPLLAGRRVLAHGNHLLEAEALSRATRGVLDRLRQAPGTALARAELGTSAGLSPAVLALVWEQVAATPGVEADALHLRMRRVAKEAPHPDLHRVEALYRKAGLQSPIVSEAAAMLKVQPRALTALLTQLLRSGRLVRLGSDQLLMHVEALAELRKQLAACRGEQFDVARFKSLTGLSRKHAIPLLEHLDGARVFRNVGGVRTVL